MWPRPTPWSGPGGAGPLPAALHHREPRTGGGRHGGRDDRLARGGRDGGGLGARYAPEAAGPPDTPAQEAQAAREIPAASALAGAVLAWTQLHGSVSLEVAGQFAGMAHRGGTLPGAHMEMPADAFGLDQAPA